MLFFYLINVTYNFKEKKMKVRLLILMVLLFNMTAYATELQRTGWNLIAVCEEINGSQIDMTTIEEIQAQDGKTIYSGEFAEHSNLERVEAGYGYWVKGKSGDVFESGASINRIENPLVRDGWNLMASCEDILKDDINMSSLEEIQSQDGKIIYTGQYANYSDLDVLINGYGYWVKGNSGTSFMSKYGLSIPEGFTVEAINNNGESTSLTYNNYSIKVYVGENNITANDQANHLSIFTQINGEDIGLALRIQSSYDGLPLVLTVFTQDGRLVGVTEPIILDGNTIINVQTIDGDSDNDDSNTSDTNSSQKIGVIFPLYVYPEDDSWREVINAKLNNPEIEILAVVNPSNGHFSTIDNGYKSYIPLLADAGINVIGYVSTRYGDRPASEVKADMRQWKAFYASVGVEGIFFDETSKHASEVSYYKELTDYAKSIGFNTTILNGGTTVATEYFSQNVADIIVTYEESYAHWNQYFRSGYLGNNQADETTDIAIMMHSVSSLDIMKEVVRQSASDGFSYMYITPDGAGDPWDSIPNYFDTEVKEILKYARENSSDSNTGDTGSGTTIVQAIAASSDDVEQNPINGAMFLNSSDLELVHEGEDQLIGLRFKALNIPKGAKINSAYIQFSVDEIKADATTFLIISAEDRANAQTFLSQAFDVSNRIQTSQRVNWDIPHWAVLNEEAEAQRTPDLKTIVQSLVDKTDWQANNAIAFIMEGTGVRTAVAYDGTPSRAAKLYVTYGADENASDDNSTDNTDANHTKSDKLGMLVPMYVYPDLHRTDSQWQRLLDVKIANPSAEIIVIANPSNGHFSVVDALYASVISKCVDAGMQVVGYVYTKYGARDINIVKADIDKWTEFYKHLGVSGIFFDETEGREAKGQRPYYTELTAYIKSKGYETSIINPGITADQTFVENYTADIIVSFESYYSNYLSDFKTGNVGKTVESEATSTALMIHDMDTLANLKQVIAEAPADGFNYVYVTSGDKGWDYLGNDFEAHISEMLRYNRD
jgi:hypothetical protein